MRNHYSSKNERRILLKRLLWGLLAAWFVTVVLCAIFAWMIASARVEQTSQGTLSMITIVLSAMTGAIIASLGREGKRWLICLLSGSIYVILLLTCNLLIFQEGINGFVSALILIFGASGTICLVTMRRAGPRNRSVKPAKFRKMYKVHK